MNKNFLAPSRSAPSPTSQRIAGSPPLMSETCDIPSVLLTIKEYSFTLQQVCHSPFSLLSPAAKPRSLFAAQVNEHLLKAQL